MTNPDTIAPGVLIRAGQALFGDNWQTPIARELGVSDRSVRYWTKGVHAIPPGVVADLVKILRARGRKMDALAAELARTLKA